MDQEIEREKKRANAQAQFEILKQVKEQQNKYVYYIIALSVASIGYSINIIIDKSYHHVLLLIFSAYFFWGLSIVCGFRYIRVSISASLDNFTYFNHLRGVEKNSLDDRTAFDQLQKATDAHSARNIKNFNWLMYWYGIGVCFFIAWLICKILFVNN